MLHDVGKIVVPDAILLKGGPLTVEEREVMQRHPITGDEICQPIRSFALVRPIIRHHHERLDGTGYPDGLAGDAIPITARVLQVVDVFDALTTERPYKPAYPVEQALTMLRDESEQGVVRSPDRRGVLRSRAHRDPPCRRLAKLRRSADLSPRPVRRSSSHPDHT